MDKLEQKTQNICNCVNNNKDSIPEKIHDIKLDLNEIGKIIKQNKKLLKQQNNRYYNSLEQERDSVLSEEDK